MVSKSNNDILYDRKLLIVASLNFITLFVIKCVCSGRKCSCLLLKCNKLSANSCNSKVVSKIHYYKCPTELKRNTHTNTRKSRKCNHWVHESVVRSTFLFTFVHVQQKDTVVCTILGLMHLLGELRSAIENEPRNDITTVFCNKN